MHAVRLSAAYRMSRSYTYIYVHTMRRHTSAPVVRWSNDRRVSHIDELRARASFHAAAAAAAAAESHLL
jgi:hypothetical protein